MCFAFIVLVKALLTTRQACRVVFYCALPSRKASVFPLTGLIWRGLVMVEFVNLLVQKTLTIFD